MLFNTIYEFERMRSLMDDLFSSSASNPAINRYNTEDLELTNVFESSEGYMVEFLAPGVKQEDVSVNYVNGILSVTLKREANGKDSKDFIVLRQERTDINFTRSYRLSDDADVNKIDAKLINGLLMVHIPKEEGKKPKKIDVKVK